MIYDEIDFRDGGNPWAVPARRSWKLGTWAKFFLGIMTLGLLLGLILPMPTRCNWPLARRFQCASNLRQLGIGISQYVNTNDCYPPGTIPNPEIPLEVRLGWGMAILPHLDLADELKHYGMTPEAAGRLAFDDPILAQIHPGFFRCPESMDKDGYLAIAGLGLDAPSLPTNHPRAGIFGDNRRVTPTDIKDGASQTMMLAESDTAIGPWFSGGRDTVRGLDPANQPYIGTKRQLGGLHQGGANVLMADGSMKFLSESTDPKILEALSTMAGGEKLPVSWDQD